MLVFETSKPILQKALQNVFGDLDDELYQLIEPHLTWVELHGGQTLFEQGDTADAIFFVVSGRLGIYLNNENTGARTKISEVIRSETVGEMAIYTEGTRSATVTAMRDCVLLRLTKADFERVVMARPAISMRVTKIIVERLNKTQAPQRITKKPINICLLALHNGMDAPGFARALSAQLSQRTTSFCVEPAVIAAEFHDPHMAFANENDPVNYRKLSDWLDQKEAENEYLFYIADGSTTEWTKRCLRQADEILLLADAQESPAITPLEQGLHDRSSGSLAPKTLILFHESQVHIPRNTHLWLEERDLRIHFHLRKDDPRGIRRMARQLSNTSVGLVMAGGGAKGFAQLGVMKALREFNVAVDFVGGTSVGSMMAGGIAFDTDADILIETMRKGAVFNPTKDINPLPFLSLISGKRLFRMVEMVTESFSGHADTRIEDTWLPFFAVSSNYTQKREVVHTAGFFAKYITASASIPGVFPPVIDGDDLLVDGGVFNNFPADVMRQRGAERIIGVDLILDKQYPLNTKHIPSFREQLADKFRPRKKRRFRLPSITTMLLNAPLLVSLARQIDTKRNIDLCFNPEVHKFSFMDWGKYDLIVDAGYRHAKQVLQEMPAEQLALFQDV